MSDRAPYDKPKHPVKHWVGEQEIIWRDETSRYFHDLMDKAMMVSFYKYGGVSLAYPERVNALASLRLRLQKYEETGNAEFLVDAANFAMIEFMYPSLENAHLTHTDADGSPGRIAANADIYDTPNQYANRDLAERGERPF